MARWKVQIQLWLAAAAKNLKRALKQVQKTVAGDNNCPDGAAPGLSTLAQSAEDITARICHSLSRPQPHFGNNPH
jgi:argininosuccinate lyase